MTGGPNTIAELAQLWADWILPLSLQVVPLFLLVALLDRLLGTRLGPGARSLLWGLVLAKFVLPVSIASPWAPAALPIATATVTSAPEALPAITESSATLGSWAFAIWSTGVLVLAGFALARFQRLGASLRTPLRVDPRVRERVERATLSAAARLRLRRVPPCRIVLGLDSPAACGLLRPFVVLPLTLLDRLNDRQLEHVLLHELAHVKRHDPLRHTFGLALQILFWFHPIAYWTRARLATLREMRCDELAARSLAGAADSYRGTLLELSRSLLSPTERGSRLAPAFVHRHGQILERLRFLERPARKGGPGRATALAIAFGTTVLCGAPSLHNEARPDDRNRSSVAELTAPPTRHDAGGAAVAPASLDDVQGCLQKRFLVMQMLAESDAQ